MAVSIDKAVGCRHCLQCHLITTSITAAIVQSFMVYRYWRLTRHHSISTLLAALIFAGLSADIIMNREFSQRPTRTYHQRIRLTVAYSQHGGGDRDVSCLAAPAHKEPRLVCVHSWVRLS
ncbi:hypothetical protein BDZ89DRAFT_1064790 [Hymenopellis radicata]|nr:hypothetical protein BDZ89DRAFT_1064790 [Hymenopellis radicata]